MGTALASGRQASSLEGVVALFDLTIDASRTMVEATPRAMRSGQKQGDIFDLDIADFQNRSSFVIRGIERTGDGYLRILFTHAHPFPAPDFTAPTTGSNRSDLGYTGRMLWLSDVHSETFYDGNVRLDPYTIKAADGYLAATDLLEAEGLTNTAFPYVLLADEAEDNRIDVSNGGDMNGNYGTIFAGWGRDNIGPGNNGWTGYDFVHQGQTIQNEFIIDPDAIPDGDLDAVIALVVRYTEPRGGTTVAEKRVNRMVPDDADATKFAYRLPHAALETSRIDLTPMTVLMTGDPVLREDEPIIKIADNPNACAAVGVVLRDWDSLAIPSGDDDLSDEPDVTKVVPGAEALPLIEIDAPDLGTRSSESILVSYDPGLPGSELKLQGQLRNDAGTLAPGTYLACMKVTDAEAGLDSDYHYGIDPGTFLPTAAPLRDVYYPITYEVFPVPAPTSARPEILGTPCELGGENGETGIFDLITTNTPTSHAWNFGGGFNPNTATVDPIIGLFTGITGVYIGSVTASNASGTSKPTFFAYNVGLPSVAEGGAFFFDAVEVTAIPDKVPSGDSVVLSFRRKLADYDTIAFDWNQNGLFTDTGEGPFPMADYEQTISSTQIYFHTLPDHNAHQPSEIAVLAHHDILDIDLIGRVEFDILPRLQPVGSTFWSAGAGTAFDQGHGAGHEDTALAYDHFADILYVAAYNTSATPVDMDPGPGVSNVGRGVMLLCYDGDFGRIGDLQWVVEPSDAAFSTGIEDIAIDPTFQGNYGPVIVGHAPINADFQGPVTSGVDSITDADCLYMARYHGADGQLQWLNQYATNGFNNRLTSVGISESGVVWAGGKIDASTQIDVDPGPPVALLMAGAGGDSVLLSSNVSTGSMLDYANFSSTGGDQDVYDIDIDNANGRFWVAGATGGSGMVHDFDPGPGTANQTNMGVDDAYLVCLTLTGDYVRHIYLANSLADQCHAVAVDPNDGSIRAHFQHLGAAPDVDPGPAVVYFGGGGGVLAYSSSGAFLWQAPLTAGSAYNIQQPVIRVDPSDSSLRLAGRFGLIADFDPGVGTQPATASGGYDPFLLRLNRFGQYQHHVIWEGPGAETMLGFDMSVRGEYPVGPFDYYMKPIFMAGTFNGATLDSEPSLAATINVSRQSGTRDLFLTGLRSDFTLTSPTP